MEEKINTVEAVEIPTRKEMIDFLMDHGEEVSVKSSTDTIKKKYLLIVERVEIALKASLEILEDSEDYGFEKENDRKNELRKARNKRRNRRKILEKIVREAVRSVIYPKYRKIKK